MNNNEASWLPIELTEADQTFLAFLGEAAQQAVTAFALTPEQLDGSATESRDQPRQDETPTKEPLHYRITEKPKPSVPLLNRAQRRMIAKYIRAKTAPLRRLQRLQRLAQSQCSRCGLPYFGVHLANTLLQCQCKVTRNVHQ